MAIEGVRSGGGIIGQIDPRVRLIVAFVYSVMVALESGPLPLAYASALPLCAVSAARLSPGALLRRLAPANLFILLLWLILPFSYPDRSVGLHHALLITVRSNLILLTTIGLLSISPVFQLARALRKLGFPRKLTQLFLLSCRYIPVIHDEYIRLRNAMRVRGFKPGTNLHTYRSYAYLVGMLLLRSYERSERIYRAMLMRGFDGELRTLRTLDFSGFDALASALLGAYLIGMGVLKWV